MFELGNKMAPVLQLGEELVAPPPPPPPSHSASSVGTKVSGGSNIIDSGSEESTESSHRDKTQSYFDKTTPVL